MSDCSNSWASTSAGTALPDASMLEHNAPTVGSGKNMRSQMPSFHLLAQYVVGKTALNIPGTQFMPMEKKNECPTF